MREVLDVQWTDLATRSELKGEVAILRSEFADLRSEMRVGFAAAEAHLERRLRSQLMWTMATMISLFSLLGALVVLTG